MAKRKAWFDEPVKREKFLTALRGGATRLQACEIAGFKWATLEAWIDEDDAISAAIADATNSPHQTMPLDDPWWALGRIVEVRAEEMFPRIEQALAKYGAEPAEFASEFGLTDWPLDDPWWALGRLLERDAPDLFGAIEEGLSVYKQGPAALRLWLAPKPVAEPTTVDAARASFVGAGSAPDQRERARVPLACVVEFSEERDQLAVLSEMAQRGFRCRALI